MIKKGKKLIGRKNMSFSKSKTSSTYKCPISEKGTYNVGFGFHVYDYPTGGPKIDGGTGSQELGIFKLKASGNIKKVTRKKVDPPKKKKWGRNGDFDPWADGPD